MPGDGPRAGAGSAPEPLHRLRRPSDIRRVLREGTALRSKRVVVYVAPGTGESRAGWIAGRKVGTAVARNRARRVLREAWRELAGRSGAGYDVVIVALPEIRGARTKDLVEEIEDILARAGVVRE